MRKPRGMAAVIAVAVLFMGIASACIARAHLHSTRLAAHADRDADALGEDEPNPITTAPPKADDEAEAPKAEPGDGDVPAALDARNARSEADAPIEAEEIAMPDLADGPDPPDEAANPVLGKDIAEAPDEPPDDTAPEDEPSEELPPEDLSPEEDPSEETPPEDNPPEDNPAESEPPVVETPLDIPDHPGMPEEAPPEEAPPDEPLTGEAGEQADQGIVLELGDYTPPSVRADTAFTLTVPVRLSVQGPAPDDGLSAWEDAVIAIADEQTEHFPLSPGVLGLERPLVHVQDDWGYAVFEDLTVLHDAEPGAHILSLRASWRGADGEMETQALAVLIEVAENGHGDVTLGAFPQPVAYAGGALTLALPIRYLDDHSDVFDSNADADGGLLPYEAENRARDYDQSLAEELVELTVAISPNQVEDFPLSQAVLSEAHALVADGENLGYAVFEELPVREDIEPGAYPVRLSVSWEDVSGARQSKELMAALAVSATYQAYQDGVIVYTYDQLKTVIEGNLFSKVYLGYDEANKGTINYTSTAFLNKGIAMPSGMKNLEIVGTDPELHRRMTLVDFQEDNMTSTLRTTTSGQTILVKHVNVTCRNRYGILYGGGNQSTRLMFEDVDFSGKAIANNAAAQSSVAFTNCRATIVKPASGHMYEVVDTPSISFYGDNTFAHPDQSGAAYPLFYLPSPGYIYVDQGATVKTHSKLNTFYVAGHGTATALIQGTLDITSGGENGCFTYAAQYFKSVAIPRGGTLKIVHNGAAYAALRTKELTVGGTLDVYKISSANPCVAICWSGSAVFNSPERVKLTHPSGYAIRGSDTATCTLEITTQAINRTASAGKHVWNNNDLSAFRVTAVLPITNSATQSVTTTLQNGGKGAVLGAPQLTTTNFNLIATTMLEFGEYLLTIDEPREGAVSVAGDATSGTALTVERYGYVSDAPFGPVIQSATGITAQSGRYRTPAGAWPYVPSPTYPQTCIYVRGNTDGLEAHIYRLCLPGLFYDVPTALDFGDIAVVGELRLMPRKTDGFAIEVYDTGFVEQWTLTASMGPLRSADGTEELEGGVAFVAPDKSMALLSPDAALPIAQRDLSAAGSVMITWPEDEGLLLYLPAMAGTPGQRYSATMIWTLEIEP